jgi:hypothetical protein
MSLDLALALESGKDRIADWTSSSVERASQRKCSQLVMYDGSYQ